MARKVKIKIMCDLIGNPHVQEVAGELYESGGFQFCIHWQDDKKAIKATEVSTGYNVGVFIDLTKDDSLMPPLYMMKGNLVGYFWLPMRYNPLLYMAGFLGSKQFSLNRIKDQFRFRSMLVVRESTRVCQCGKERTLISLATGKPLPVGKECLKRALLAQELK